MELKCSKCKNKKDEKHFHKNKSTKSGFSSICKECMSLYWKKPKEKIKEGFKRCTVCNEIKIIKNFSKKHTIKDGLRSSCKECNKKYREKTKEHTKEYRKQYNVKNNEKIKEYRKKYFKENKEKIYEQKRKYRKKNKHIFAWKNILRNTLIRMNTKKDGHTIDILGYSANDLKKHIGEMFTSNMSWNNYGEWHIDHIKAISSFESNTHVSIVCSLDNLQPLWATTREIDGVVYIGNLNKSNK